MPRLTLAPLVILLAATCGCSSLAGWTDTLNPFTTSYVRADEKNPAVEVACIWQPGEGRNEKGIPARGFSGQVFFFTGRNSEPALVDGAVRVYLFADRGTPEERAKPLRQFDFAPEAWAMHATKTSLGPGYTVFIPYPTEEPYQVRCQLRARFTPRQGPSIWSESVTMTLEGPPRPNDSLPMAARDPNAPAPTVANAQLTHHTAPVSELNKQERRLRTDTFKIGEIAQTAYDSPARDELGMAKTVDIDDLDAATLRRMLKETVKERDAADHPPQVDRERSGAIERHPLQDAPAEPRRSSTRYDATTAPEEAGLLTPSKRIRLAPRQPMPGKKHPFAEATFGTPSDVTRIRPADHPLIDSNPVPRIDDFASEADPASSTDYGVWQQQGE